MARTRRPSTGGTRRGRSTTRRGVGRGRGGLPLPRISLGVSPAVVRSLVGIFLLALGAVTLIALALPGEGALTDWWRDLSVPFFGTGRWLLPFVLLVAGWYLEWGPGRHPGAPWGRTLLGILLAYSSLLGAFQIVAQRGGGHIGRFLAGALEPLLTTPGALILLVAGVATGLLVAFDLPLRALLAPAVASARTLAASFQDRSAKREGTGAASRRGAAAGPGAAPTEPGGRRGRMPRISAADAPGQTEAWSGSEVVPRASILDEPAPPGAPAPMSQTVWLGGGAPVALGGDAGAAPSVNGHAVPRERANGAGADEEQTALDMLHDIEWTLPTVDLLEPRPVARAGAAADHTANIARIEDKLRNFGLDAKVVGVNSGPVVTQYEVRPEHHVKLSRIEALADDLAMALAARSIRIEAPIPGKSVVGIEIPNQSSEVVGFRPFLDERPMHEAPSPLMFALGRDVSGQAFAVDLARMPHLLVAGATGSGKSVCVNAIITSILMRAKPHEVRMVLVDLKRVELAPYNKLPHLLQHVIVEPDEAKSVLIWAVNEMEDRYKKLAGRTVRNVAAYNALTSIAPEDKLPYVVIIIDELADLIMREGRKVEDPIVKIAQKARAVGIHLVLATQRPSVNVVTGLIKANVPSRIAFAMASMVDSRTVLDSPGAEDLIGRGDMLYQPVDMPRPVRLQGVFVSDQEVNAVTKHWLDQAGGRVFYDETILEFAGADDDGNGGQFAWLAARDVDEMTPRAAELVTTTGKASTSSLQTKLRLGFSRASRVMDELERYGIVGPQDPRNPATPRIVYGPENWLRTDADSVMDD